MTNTGLLSSERSYVGVVAALAAAAGVSMAVTLGVLGGFGWLYLFHVWGWLDAGPRVGDALPLLQLASADGQPLLALLVAWLLAGAVVGLFLIHWSPGRRTLIGGIVALILLLVASQAADALARNLRFRDVLFTREPGLGPWLEALVFAIGCALPRRFSIRPPEWTRRRSAARERVLRHLGLSGGELGHAAQDHRDRDQVDGNRRRVRAK
jgi:hypothetical protein